MKNNNINLYYIFGFLMIIAIPLTAMSKLRFQNIFGIAELLLILTIFFIGIYSIYRKDIFKTYYFNLLFIFWFLIFLIFILAFYYYGLEKSEWIFRQDLSRLLYHGPLHDLISYTLVASVTLILLILYKNKVKIIEYMLYALIFVTIINFITLNIFVLKLQIFENFSGSNASRFVGLSKNPNQLSLLVLFSIIFFFAYIELKYREISNTKLISIIVLLPFAILIGFKTESFSFNISLYIFLALITFFELLTMYFDKKIRLRILIIPIIYLFSIFLNYFYSLIEERSNLRCDLLHIVCDFEAVPYEQAKTGPHPIPSYIDINSIASYGSNSFEFIGFPSGYGIIYDHNKSFLKKGFKDKMIIQIIDPSDKNHGKYLAIKVTEDRIHISDFDDVNNNRQFNKTLILGFLDDNYLSLIEKKNKSLNVNDQASIHFFDEKKVNKFEYKDSYYKKDIILEEFDFYLSDTIDFKDSVLNNYGYRDWIIDKNKNFLNYDFEIGKCINIYFAHNNSGNYLITDLTEDKIEFDEIHNFKIDGNIKPVILSSANCNGVQYVSKGDIALENLPKKKFISNPPETVNSLEELERTREYEGRELNKIDLIFQFFKSEVLQKISKILAKFDARSTLVKNAYKIIKQSPYIGYGPGSYLSDKDETIFGKREAHNSIIDLTINTGIIGLLIFVTLFLYIFYILFKSKQFFLFSGLITLIIFSQFHHILRHPIVWFFIIMCLISANRNILKKL